MEKGYTGRRALTLIQVKYLEVEASTMRIINSGDAHLKMDGHTETSGVGCPG